ncbi:DUF6884 domain-containing protein [Streptomyces sp. NPDC048489]|uniref:DUF6884 domain-containing protein n=1 Tax=Streptomyces sp. NPDC048489 TaxID=3154504 RepID=UPI003435EDDB
MKITVPGQLRRHAAKGLDPKTRGESALQAACRKEVERLEYAGKSFLVTSDIELTNDALGAALEIAREWMTSSNGNNQRAGLSVLKAHELDYEPDDPREIRTEVKAPKSLAEMYQGAAKPATEVLTEDIKRLNWSTGVSGRVRPETLAWLIERARYWAGMHPTPSIQKAAKKFTVTYGERHESLQRMIASTLEIEDETEAPASEPKRLILVSCGGKKLDTDRALARAMYVGNYHLACRAAADVMGEWTMILSAKYGLVGLDDEIDAYDVRPTDPEAITSEELTKQATDLEILDAHVTVLGGSDYVKLVRQVWPDAEAPLSGGIGQQLKQLAKIYKGEVLEDDERQAPAAEPGRQIGRRKMMSFVQWSDRPKYLHFYGTAKAKQKPNPEGIFVYSTWTEATDGFNLLKSVETGELVATVHSNSYIWAAHPDPSEIPAPEVEEKEEEPAAEPERSFRNELRLIPGVPSLNRPISKVVWFGGKVRKNASGPSEKWRQASISYVGEGEYEVWDLATEETLLRCKGNAWIAWGPVVEAPVVEVQEPEEMEEIEEPAPVETEPEPAPEPTPAPKPQQRYEVPENFLYMAEEADTETARAWWKRRCERYAETGE